MTTSCPGKPSDLYQESYLSRLCTISKAWLWSDTWISSTSCERFASEGVLSPDVLEEDKDAKELGGTLVQTHLNCSDITRMEDENKQMKGKIKCMQLVHIG